MFKRAAFVLLVLGACTPEAKPPETSVAPAVEAPVTPPAPVASDAAKYKAALDGDITVKTPLANARVTSPLVVEGTAINNWFFEGQFVAELVVEGTPIDQKPAMQAGTTNWTDPGPVDFRAEMTFAVTKETAAELILSEDMPEYIDEANDIRGPARSVRIPVTLVPAAK